MEKKFNKEIPERVGLAFYTNNEGEVEIEVYLTDESMWMSQQIMENSTTRKIRVVEQEGKRQVNREIQFYNLDMEYFKNQA